MTPGTYAAGGLGPTFAALSSESEFVIVRSYCFSRLLRRLGAAARFSNHPSPRRNQIRPRALRRGLPIAFAHRSGNFALDVALLNGVALVEQLFAPADAQFQLHAAILQIDGQWNQRQSLLGHLLIQLENLIAVHQQLLGAERIGIGKASLLIGRDMQSVDKQLAVIHRCIAILQIHAPHAHGLDLRAPQLQTGFVRFLYEVVVPRLAIQRDHLYTLGRHNITPEFVPT